MLVVDAGARPAISTTQHLFPETQSNYGESLIRPRKKVLGVPGEVPSIARDESRDLLTPNPQPISSKYLNVNRNIRSPEIRLIDENDRSLGILRTDEALRIANERGFDLVEVAPHAKPPVCKLLDFGAYLYRLEKQERKSKAHQKRIEVKGVRISFKIGEHDRQVRQETAKRFLAEGHKVKIEMILRGREFAHQDRARELVNQFIKDLGDRVVIEQPLNKQGNKLFCLIGMTKQT